jgi:hypothetical protein
MCKVSQKDSEPEEKPKETCEHRNAYVRREGMTSIIGTVICPDCGHEREWNAY